MMHGVVKFITEETRTPDFLRSNVPR